MKKNNLFKFMGIGMVILLSLVLVGCGRDVSTVEGALEGHWTVTDARVNGQPLEEAIAEYDDVLDIDSDSFTTSEEGQTEIDIDFYYDEEILTIVNAEGDQFQLAYEVLNADEENNAMTLEYLVEDEEADLKLTDEIAFIGEDRDSILSTINIVDVNLKEAESEEQRTELEEEFYQFGQDFVLEIFRNLNIEFDLDYVDDAEAPANE